MTDTTESQASLEQLKNLIYVSIISADNDRYPEDIKQMVLHRHKERPNDWKYILDPLGEDAKIYIEILGS